ncbi:hypothetical protein [Hymenobacter psoromatis]|uniref:hypothetical protein n=1 Tax=Hymenobacter psoromatis TaxID=1484116 RepID=UPI001CC0156A|nr:hypothetical protein [Hymenobacter psoromatis]
MKELLLALLLPAYSTHAQSLPTPPTPTELAPPAGQEAPTPFKLANVIVVHTPDSARTAYRKLATLLLAQGYQLAETDSAQGRITTDYHRSAYRRIKVSLHFVIIAQATGSLIEEQAIGQVTTADSRFGVECRGTPNMPIACAWSEMWRLASRYPAGSLAYKRE